MEKLSGPEKEFAREPVARPTRQTFRSRSAVPGALRAFAELTNSSCRS